jgi:hypothetical protein
MRSINLSRKVVLILMCFLFLSSCRMGKIMSEADPDTKTEVESEKDDGGSL